MIVLVCFYHIPSPQFTNNRNQPVSVQVDVARILLEQKNELRDGNLRCVQGDPAEGRVNLRSCRHSPLALNHR